MIIVFDSFYIPTHGKAQWGDPSFIMGAMDGEAAKEHANDKRRPMAVHSKKETDA